MFGIRKLVTSTAANVGVTFAVSAVPLIMAVGGTVDYMGASEVRSALQNAVDNAALAAGASEDFSDAALKEIVRDYLKKNRSHDLLDKVSKIRVIRSSDKKVRVRIDGFNETNFMRLVGISKLKIGASSTVIRDFGNLEVVMVLDNTGSMAADGKMDDLKAAARLLVNEMHNKKGASATLKFGIVPFSNYVNVGLSRRNEPWIDVPPDTTETTTSTQTVTPIIPGSQHNCRNVTNTHTTTNDGVTSTNTSTSRVCDYEYGPPEEREVTYTKTTKWYGCVGSRNYPLNIQDGGYVSRIPGLMNVGCGREFTPLTENKATIDAEIDAMVATGDTYIPTGLAWGWRMLSAKAPLKEAVSYRKMDEKGYHKAIVLMTDGVNTLSPAYPAHVKGGDLTVSNNLTSELCTKIKASGHGGEKRIKIYTVAFKVDDVATKQMLKDCATDSGSYFDASDRDALAQAFGAIARSLITLRIAK